MLGKPLKPVQPPVSAGIVSELRYESKFVCAVAVFHHAVQTDIKGISEDQFVNTDPCHHDNGMTGPVRQTHPVRLLIKKLTAYISLQLAIL